MHRNGVECFDRLLESPSDLERTSLFTVDFNLSKVYRDWIVISNIFVPLNDVGKLLIVYENVILSVLMSSNSSEFLQRAEL